MTATETAQIDSLPVRLTTESRFARHTTIAELGRFGSLPFSAEVAVHGLVVTYAQGYQFGDEGWTELTVGRTGRSVYLRGAQRADFLAAVGAAVQGKTLDEIYAAW